MKVLYGLALLTAFCTASFAQALPDDGRGSTPPGAAQDGSRPDEGAITGGAIVPGESGGVPSEAKQPPVRGVRRCNELTGTLRDQCLRQEEGSSAGGSVPDPASGKAPPPRIDPPPQNPH